MRKLAYEIFVDVYRLAYKYRFQKLDIAGWGNFITDGEKLMGRYWGTAAESLFRNLFAAVQNFYEKLGQGQD
ncbi:hypothetical protein IMSAGC019_03105 [Lachnospiraceae bacterium]|nr:hypothetical protein IMSAGC019_03105 [Lachnospiraceae bacterium]